MLRAAPVPMGWTLAENAANDEPDGPGARQLGLLSMH